MGWGIRELFSTDEHIDELLTEFPKYRCLIYAGFGWSRLVRFGRPSDDVLPSTLDSILGGLIVDGIGFAEGLLKRPWHFRALRPPKASQAFRRVWAQGYGRSLWFISRRPRLELENELSEFAEELHPDLYMGLGLATAFVAGGHPGRSLKPSFYLPTPPPTAFHQGLAFGLYARRDTSPQLFEEWCATLSPEMNAWVENALRACEIPPLRQKNDLLSEYVSWQDHLRSSLPHPPLV